jgi:hypothetical protein
MGGHMKQTKSNKWRMAAILIACIAAYAVQDDDASSIANGNTLTAQYTAAIQR